MLLNFQSNNNKRLNSQDHRDTAEGWLKGDTSDQNHHSRLKVENITKINKVEEENDQAPDYLCYKV